MASLPLFIHQPFCNERTMCQECRGEDDRYRRGWAARYAMPVGWPECPFGLPFGALAAPQAVEPWLLGIEADDPESSEAKEIAARIEARAATVRPICLQCEYFQGITEDGRQVDCEVGYSCNCGTENLSRGFVHLGSGSCRKHRWSEKP